MSAPVQSRFDDVIVTHHALFLLDLALFRTSRQMNVLTTTVNINKKVQFQGRVHMNHSFELPAVEMERDWSIVRQVQPNLITAIQIREITDQDPIFGPIDERIDIIREVVTVQKGGVARRHAQMDKPLKPPPAIGRNLNHYALLAFDWLFGEDIALRVFRVEPLGHVFINADVSTVRFVQHHRDQFAIGARFRACLSSINLNVTFSLILIGRFVKTNPRVKNEVLVRRAIVPSWVTLMFWRRSARKRKADSIDDD
ncbi:hypothetical protein TcasGA2_TC015128 [Tribolium castaneum]|uniref:Uncharacterized protein n=1 Tax=Tribolium castaneum TaxID=7070 RepID=D2A5R0_TRICA|nr:hypothetical protein TcasGA2_TC015128 [Tribolium castaneum]